MTFEILRKAFPNDSQTIIDEIAKCTKFKYIGTATNVDLHIHITKGFAEKKITGNLFAIKEAIEEIEDKNVRDVYINNVKQEVQLGELNSQHQMGLIDLDTISLEKTNEMSGENNIVDDLFKYETSVLNKTKVTLFLYQKEINKEWKEEINTSIVKNKFSFKRKALARTLRRLIDLRYEPNDNDTKEILELLEIK